jgi:hypothetical protein
MLADTATRPDGLKKEDWFVPVAIIVTAVLLIPAGCLLFARRRAALWAALILLLAGASAAAYEAVLIYRDNQRPGGAIGKALVGQPVFFITLMAIVVVLFALVRLSQVLMRRDGADGRDAAEIPAADGDRPPAG